MDVLIPNDLWEGDQEAVINIWLFDDGANVREGVVIAELMVEKTMLELLAPASGRIEILQKADALVKQGDLVATIL
jgi:pyruvate/2-oxoglutarate dehydrogenase complex dihydrolipoamide acyltransferase (E2) component